MLGREFTDDELLATVGGPGLEAQMQVLGRGHVDELVRVYRAHNEPLHDTLEFCAGMDERPRDAEGARAAGSASSRRSGAAPSSSRSRACRSRRYFEAIVGGDETERHKPDPEPLLLGARTARRDAADAAYVGDSPFDMQAARAAGMFAVGVTWGGIHGRDTLGDADVVVDTAEELLAVL